MNRERVYGDGKTSIDEALTEFFGDHRLYVAARGDVPGKPQRSCTETLLAKEKLKPHETIIIGSTEADFQTAVNGSVLFLNAGWDRQEAQYGFPMLSPLEVQRFVELFALRDHHWFYKIDTPLQYRSLAPFSTMLEAYRDYSEIAREAAKTGTEQRLFFLHSLVGSLYFSGELADIDYIACMPGHKAGYGNPQMDDVLRAVGGTMRARYIPDLIVRHTDAPSRRKVKSSGSQPNPLDQWNTIRLTKLPLKGDKRYKAPLKLKGKTVLVFDDFTTNGVSLEAARHYLRQTGANVRAVSWLKTINTGYTVATPKAEFDPYEVNTFVPGDIDFDVLPYKKFIVDSGAPIELEEALKRFQKHTPKR